MSWLYTLIELGAWNRAESDLVDRSERPWDHEPRRPGHADKRNSLRRECLRATISATVGAATRSPKFQAILQRLTALVS